MFKKSNGNDSDTVERDELYYRWKLPPKEKTESDYKAFISRGARLLCIYTAGWRCNYAGQLAEVFASLDFADIISAQYLPNATHTFKVEEDRVALITAMKSWLQANWDLE